MVRSRTIHDRERKKSAKQKRRKKKEKKSSSPAITFNSPKSKSTRIEEEIPINSGFCDFYEKKRDRSCSARLFCFLMMPCCCSTVGPRIRSWLRDYDFLQSVAVVLIYIQIGCALLGSLGALFNGVLLINLVIALFALVAIESSSQSLGRTYAVLLFFAIVLDIAWFILFAHTIWNISPDQKFGPLLVFSLRLALSMEIIGFSVRFLSSFLWIQMYRLGVSTVDNTIHRVDYSVRNSFVNPPTHEVTRQHSTSDEILGGSIYDPAYYSSLFEDSQDKLCMSEGDKQIVNDGHSSPAVEAPKLRSCVSKSFQVIDVDNALRRPLLQ